VWGRAVGARVAGEEDAFAFAIELLETSRFHGSAKHCIPEAKLDLPLQIAISCWSQS
jgi:hypothetical protein